MKVAKSIYRFGRWVKKVSGAKSRSADSFEIDVPPNTKLRKEVIDFIQHRYGNGTYLCD